MSVIPASRFLTKLARRRQTERRAALARFIEVSARFINSPRVPNASVRRMAQVTCRYLKRDLPLDAIQRIDEFMRSLEKYPPRIDFSPYSLETIVGTIVLGLRDPKRRVPEKLVAEVEALYQTALRPTKDGPDAA